MRRSLSFIAALLSAAAASYGSVDAGLVALLPATTKAVFNVNAQEARDSDFGQFLLKDLRWSDPGLQEMLTATGFDPRRDLQTVLIATDSAAGMPHGPGAGNSSLKPLAVLARGTFDASKIEAAMLQHGAVRQSIGGVDVYVSQERAGAQRGLAFLDVDIAVVGDLGSVTQMIANRANPSQLDPTFAQLVSAAGVDHEVWFAAQGLAGQMAAAMNPNAAQQAQAKQIMQSIVQSSGGMKLGKTVQLSFDAVARSDKDASSLGDVIRFLASAAQLKRDQDPHAVLLAPMLDNLNLTTSGNEVHVTTAVPEGLLEQMTPPMRAQHGSTPAKKQ